jgi:hypothetical protein
MNPWVTLAIKKYRLPAILDYGSSFSFMRRDVFQRISALGLLCSSEATNREIHVASGQGCVISDLVSLQIKIRSFSWKYTFFVLDHSPVPCILGADFLAFAKIRIDFATSSYSFAFDKAHQYDFEPMDSSLLRSGSFPFEEEVSAGQRLDTSSLCTTEGRELDKLVSSFSTLFSDQLGTVKGMVCHLDLTDDQPVRSRPYQCSPPRLQALREIVQDLLQKGVVRKSFSQYASPAFLLPKPERGFSYGGRLSSSQ